MLLLSGCHSQKTVVVSGGSGKTTDIIKATDTRVAAEALRDVSDPMERDIVERAMGWLGTRYLYGGDSRDGTDCSGFVMSLYRETCALKLPRTTSAQMEYCSKRSRKDARVGDLVFFGGTKGSGNVTHVGVYIGKGEMIHASSSRGVTVSSIDDGYWGERFKAVGRVDGASGAWAANNGGKSGRNKKEKNLVVPPVTPMASVTKPDDKKAPEVTVDLIDLIISEKVDSIFSSQFMD
ncbi:MAG: C40 family peptidase [Bacteroidales bacterium]|nr:C40 family peptidase [Bacteroidales bacterium]